MVQWPECKVCEKPDQDGRTLSMKYNYDLLEISDKFTKESDGSYSIFTCKDCRGNLLGILTYWIEGNLVEEDSHPDRNIPVRVHGRIVMMSDTEWKAYTAKQGEPDQKPRRLI